MWQIKQWQPHDTALFIRERHFRWKYAGFERFVNVLDSQWLIYWHVVKRLIPLYGKAFPVLRKSPFGVMTCTVSWCGTGISVSVWRCFRTSKSLFRRCVSKFPDIHGIWWCSTDDGLLPFRSCFAKLFCQYFLLTGVCGYSFKIVSRALVWVWLILA